MMNNVTPVVKNLILLNVSVFAICLTFPELTNSLAMHYYSSQDFRPWQIVTHMFTHANPREILGDGSYRFDPSNIFHIVFNMYGLYIFGTSVEQVVGSKRFAFLYFFAGFGAIFLHTAISAFTVWFKIHSFNLQPEMFLTDQGLNLWNHYESVMPGFASDVTLYHVYFSNLVGASGAIYGLLAVFGFLFPDEKLMLLFFPVPIKAKYFIPGVLVLYDFYYGQMGHDNVAHYAHIGGALFGFLLVLFWRKVQKIRF